VANAGGDHGHHRYRPSAAGKPRVSDPRSRVSRRVGVALVIAAALTTAAAVVIDAVRQTSTPPRPDITTEVPWAGSAGPQRTISCPVGAVDISPGADIPRVVDSRPSGTTFCLKAGVHAITAAITPKSGHTFVGEYGAVLDGTGWKTTDRTQGAFRAHNQDVDDVTIRNLVIRNMPQKGIHAFRDFSDRWTIEYNEIASNQTGVSFANHSLLRNNYIHHNIGNRSASDPAERGGGYAGYQATDTILDTNEIAYNGPEQKVMESVNVTFRNNFVHHNVGDGIWYDGGNPGAVIENNRVEDNERNGIFFEASRDGVIRNNTVRRSGDTGVFISASQKAEIHHNQLESNVRGIIYFIDCTLTGPSRALDLANNSAHDNTIRVGAQRGAIANGFTYTRDCGSTQLAAYLNGSKNLTFSRNRYYVPSPTGSYWLWNGSQPWSQWRSLGHDMDGAIAP
jgi:parallel beta-helix repeat protein